MRRALVALALCATLSLVALVPINAEGTESYYGTYIWNLASSTEPIGSHIADEVISGSYTRLTTTENSDTKAMSIPLNLNDEFNRLYIGVTYNKNVAFAVDADYTLKISFTFGAVADYANTTGLPLWKAPMDHPYFIYKTGRKLALTGSQKAEETASNTYTFTYTGLKYTDFNTEDCLYLDFPLSSLESADNNILYITATYFGLTSEYDEDQYKSEILSNLQGISSSLNETNEKLDGIDASIDDLKDTIEGQLDAEKDKVEDGGGSILGDGEEAVDAIPDFSESYNSMINNLTTSLYDASTQDYIPLPSGKVTIMGAEVDILGGQTKIDLSPYLSNTDIQKLIQLCKGLSVLACMATSYFWAMTIRKALTSYDAEIPVEVPFLPGGGKF